MSDVVRTDRISVEMQREISDIIKGLKDPRIGGMISVTRVEVTRDLRHAKVYVSVYDKDEESAKASFKAIESAGGFIRREVGARMKIRYTPLLHFVMDDSIAYGAHILEVLRDPEKVKPVNPDNDAVLPDEED